MSLVLDKKEREMQVVWQGDGNEYDVVEDCGSYYILDIHGVAYSVIKKDCVMFHEQSYENHKHTIRKEEAVTGAVKECKHNHYHKDVSKLTSIDVYKVCELFGVDDKSGAIHHAIKKLLCSGYRGVKDKKQDVQEAVDTLNRWIEMQGE